MQHKFGINKKRNGRSKHKIISRSAEEEEEEDGDDDELNRWPNDGTGKEMKDSLMQRYSDNSVFLRVNKINDSKTIQQWTIDEQYSASQKETSHTHTTNTDTKQNKNKTKEIFTELKKANN